jgi:hypothetical protein
LALVVLAAMTRIAELAVEVLPSALSRLPVVVVVRRLIALPVSLAVRVAAVRLTEAQPVPLAALETHRPLHRHRVTMAALLRRPILTMVPVAAAVLVALAAQQLQPARAVTAVPVSLHL